MTRKAYRLITFIFAALVMTGMTALDGCPTSSSSGGGAKIPDKSGGGRSGGGYLRLNWEPGPASNIALDDAGEEEK